MLAGTNLWGQSAEMSSFSTRKKKIIVTVYCDLVILVKTTTKWMYLCIIAQTAIVCMFMYRYT